MSDEDELCSRRDTLLEFMCDLIETLRGDRYFDELQHQAFANFPLPQRREHPGIILCRREYLVARFQIQPHEKDLERLRCITGDRDFLTVASEDFRKAGADRF